MVWYIVSDNTGMQNCLVLIFRVMVVGLGGTCESASQSLALLLHMCGTWYLWGGVQLIITWWRLEGPRNCLCLPGVVINGQNQKRCMPTYCIEILHLQRIFRWTLDQKSWHRMGLVQQQRWWPFLIAGPVSKFLSHCIQYTLFVVCKRLENSNL